MRRLGEAFAALLALATPGTGAPGAPPPPSSSFELLDLEGRRVQPLENPGPGFVFVLTSTDCPLSNRYAPELQRLHRRFAPAGVVFHLVYPDRSQHAEDVRRHLREFGYTFGALRDPEHNLVRTVHATVTPEVAVFVPGPRGPRLAYRGRIDDRYVDLGRARPAPATRDLEQVLEAIVAGKRVTTRTTPAVGCFIPDPD
jgi:AhpC/TSA family protein